MTTVGGSMTDIDLAVPVYLDRNAMLDLLASIDGGFSTVERVTSTATDVTERTMGADTDLGASGFLSSFLRIGFSGNVTATKGGTADNSRESERYYTSGSLLHKLRQQMRSDNLIHRIATSQDQWTSLKPSNFVEFRGVFSPNPLAHAIRMFLRFMELGSKLGVPEATGPVSGNTGKQNRSRGSVPNGGLNAQISTFKAVLDDLEQGTSRLLIIEPTVETPYTVVAAIDTRHLRDESLQELLDGEYRVLGQVTRHLPENSVTSINLLRSSTLGTMVGDQFNKSVDDLNTSMKAAQFRLPLATTEIAPPALQIIPIAIYP